MVLGDVFLWTTPHGAKCRSFAWPGVVLPVLFFGVWLLISTFLTSHIWPCFHKNMFFSKEGASSCQLIIFLDEIVGSYPHVPFRYASMMFGVIYLD
jgi:hypothetical protein